MAALLAWIYRSGWATMLPSCNRRILRTPSPMSFLPTSLRAIGAAGALLAALGIADAQSTRVGKATVVGTGLYEVGESKAVEDRDISTGQRTTGSNMRRIESTTTVILKTDLIFGVEV